MTYLSAGVLCRFVDSGLATLNEMSRELLQP